MAQATAKTSFADRIAWDTRIKPWLTILVIAALAFLIALFIVAPRRAIEAEGNVSVLHVAPESIRTF